MTALAPVVSLAGIDDGTGPEADRVAAAIDRACTDVSATLAGGR